VYYHALRPLGRLAQALGPYLTNRISLAALLLVSLALLACVRREHDSLSISEVISRRSALDGREVWVHGFIVIDALDHPNFMQEIGVPSGERITKSIDLVPGTSQAEASVLRAGGACVVAHGIFHLYGPRTITVGNLVSIYGQIEAQAVQGCSR